MSLTVVCTDDTDFFEGFRTADYADHTDTVVEAFVSNTCVILSIVLILSGLLRLLR